MEATDAFETRTEQYEAWFEANEPTYRSELRALERYVSADDRSLEIGVGSGRFAAPLGIDEGVDPAISMLRRARERGISVTRGVAERLPYRSDAFEVTLIVTTICFVDDIDTTLREARRVLEPAGRLVLGYIDRESVFGQHYLDITDQNPFYRDADFVSTDELLDRLAELGYESPSLSQTVFGSPGEHDTVDDPEPGYGEGSFVAISVRAPS